MTAPDLLFCEEFLRRYEPGVLDLFLDPKAVLREATVKAGTLAEQAGARQRSDGHYPLWVWLLTFP